MGFFSCSGEVVFTSCAQLYIRDCYYRLITELLLFDFASLEVGAFPRRLVVLGNPGIGKSVLPFLFMRCLLELEVEV